MIREVLKDIETQAARRDMYKNNRGGKNGLAEGYAPHMLDVANLAKQAWDGITQETIARCWVKANCLPVSTNASITAVHGKVRRIIDDEPSEDLVEAFRNLRFSIEDSNPTIRAMPELVQNEGIERWLNIEENDEVSDAIISDITENIANVT